MEARDGDGGASGGEFASDLRVKARRIEELAVRKRAEDINDFVGGGTRLPTEDEYFLYGTRTGQVVAVEVVPGTPEWTTIESKYSWVPEVFETFTRLPDPKGFDSLTAHLERTLDVFGLDPSGKGEPRITRTVWGNLKSTSGWIEDWYGEAATQFAEFSDPFDEVTNNHAAVAHVLHRGLVATANVFESARKDVRQIADATLTALKGKSYLGGDDLYFLLVITTAVAGFLGSLPAATATLPIFFGAGNSLASAAKDTVGRGDAEESKIEAAIGGHTVDAILTSMAQELSRLNRLIDEEERKLITILDRNLDVLKAPETRVKVEAPRPRLTDLSTGPVRPHFRPPQ